MAIDQGLPESVIRIMSNNSVTLKKADQPVKLRIRPEGTLHEALGEGLTFVTGQERSDGGRLVDEQQGHDCEHHCDGGPRPHDSYQAVPGPYRPLKCFK